MRTILFQTASIYLLATAISFVVAAVIKLIERSLRPATPPRDPRA